MSLVCRPYSPEIDSRSFVCTAEEMSTYLNGSIARDVAQHICSAFHVFYRNELAGYFTLSPFSMLHSALPQQTARRIPRYKDVPMWLLGRIAVDSRFAGNGFGTAVAGLALARIGRLCKEHGGIGAVVDVLNDDNYERRVNFYKKHLGFKKIPGESPTYFLPLKTILQLPDVEER